MAGTLHIEEQRINELYAFLEGLKIAYIEEQFDIELESDHEEAYWEWHNARELGVVPQHRYVVQQLQQRRADKNFKLDVRPIDANANALAAYLARYGAENWDRMVILTGPVGRVFEIWCNDMGLGPIGNQFMAVNELDIAPNVENNEDDEAEELLQMDEDALGQGML